jgi:hypothetical protein
LARSTMPVLSETEMRALMGTFFKIQRYSR